MKEFLVTAQGYDKTDEYKQTILLHDVFMAKDTDDAKSMFHKKFEDDYKILKIYSSLDMTNP